MKSVMKVSCLRKVTNSASSCTGKIVHVQMLVKVYVYACVITYVAVL